MMSGRKRTSSNVPFTSGKPESKKHRPHSTNGHYSQGILSNKERNSLPSTQPIVEDDMDDDLPATQQSCVSELEQSLWSAPNKNDVTKAVPLDKDQIDRLQTESQEKDLTKSQSETVLKSEIAERDEDIHRLNAEICVLYEKLTQNSAQLMSHEEQIQRLSLSRDDVHRELEHKETQLRRLDSDLSIAKEERRKADDVLSRREITIQQMENDLDMVKQQYREAVEENGRLKARIQAFAINAQSEQDVLSSEVKRSEDGIKRLKMIKVNLQESNSKYAKKPPSSQPQRPPVSQIVTIQPQQPQVARVVRPNTQPVATSAGPPTTSSQAPGQGHAQQPLDNVKKCKNFLSTLIKLASSQPEQTVKNVRELIQGLIDNKVEPEQFTERLQKELKSSPQPYLVPFLRKSLPLLRQSLLENKMHIEGVKPPPIEVMKGTPFIPSAPGVQQHIRLPQHVDGLQIRPRVMPPRPVIPKTAMSAGSTVPSPASASAAGTSKPHSKPKYESLKDDDDINDVATMGGVNLSEESKNILGSNAEFIGTQIRSCADEAFLYHPALQKRVSCIARKHGLDVQGEVLNLVSHATQERLRDLVEKLATIAEHRIEIYKMNDRFESSTDVKSQLKFIEELDKLEKKRHEEQEWEKIMKAAKSRSKNEDPEQQKIKQKARELQQAENDRMRQKEANLTALAAIGPRKKRRTDNMEHQAGSSSLNLQNGPQSASRATLSRPRIKRVTLRDLLFLMEEERTLCRSKMLYKTFLK